MWIDIIFDTVCPWCFIGKRRLEQALRSRPAAHPEIRWRPFLLNPEMPPEGIDRTAYLVRKFGSESRVRQIYGTIADAGQSVEINFAFDRIRHTPNTLNSHRLVRFAAEHGKADLAVEALFLNYFVNARDIGDVEVLMAIGRDLELDAGRLGGYLGSAQDISSIYDENARAHRLGINGVPSYVFPGGMVISGAHEPAVLARMLDVANVAAAE